MVQWMRLTCFGIVQKEVESAQGVSRCLRSTKQAGSALRGCTYNNTSETDGRK
jgi:hypothetical protein